MKTVDGVYTVAHIGQKYRRQMEDHLKLLLLLSSSHSRKMKINNVIFLNINIDLIVKKKYENYVHNSIGPGRC